MMLEVLEEEMLVQRHLTVGGTEQKRFPFSSYEQASAWTCFREGNLPGNLNLLG